MEIKRNNYTVKIDEPIVYADNQKRKRSGHMTHAMAEFAPGKVIDFNSNCSAVRWMGHSPYGWIEYRISEDSGKTFGEINTLPYSVESFLDGVYAISVEKAVATDDGTIVAFCLRNDATGPTACEPWNTPTCVTSCDGGKNWSLPNEIIPYRGRIYDAVYHKGIIYVLIFCNENFIGKEKEHVYRIYKSEDNGKSFEELCIPPIDGIGRGYSSLLFDDEDVLHVYAYNDNSQSELDHAISRDFGKTWDVLKPCFMAKGARNPQTAIINGVYVLHCRAQDMKSLVLYTSEDGQNWDEGICVSPHDYGAGAYYSNNIRIKDEKGEFLLVQYSSPYTEAENPEFVCTVNVMHTKVRIER